MLCHFALGYQAAPTDKILIGEVSPHDIDYLVNKPHISGDITKRTVDTV
jgi:hypothetical protein